MTTIEDEFEVYLVSNGSMDVYPQNTLAAFYNRLSEPLHLTGNWRVALSEITFSSAILTIPPQDFEVARPVIHESGDYTQRIEILKFQGGMYESVLDLIDDLEETSGITLTSKELNSKNGILTIGFSPGEGWTFYSAEGGTSTIPAVMGIRPRLVGVMRDYRKGRHIGRGEVLRKLDEIQEVHKEPVTGEYPEDIRDIIRGEVLERLDDDDEIQEAHNEPVKGEYPADITVGTQLVFAYVDIISHQHLADVKAPILRIIDNTKIVRNGRVQRKQTTIVKRFDSN